MILLSLRGGRTKQSQDLNSIDFRDYYARNDRVKRGKLKAESQKGKAEVR